jgi:hypothetical protein
MSIDVLEEIQKLNKENSDNNKIKLGFEEETNEKSSHWTNVACNKKENENYRKQVRL